MSAPAARVPYRSDAPAGPPRAGTPRSTSRAGLRSRGSLAAGVPLVAAPQPVLLASPTASRNGPRRSRRPTGASPEALREAVLTAAEDAGIRKRVTAMAGHARAGGGAGAAADAIEAYAERS
ncbi:hypothetical protein SGLAM104S_00236 [Streptomyces glaucescens]